MIATIRTVEGSGHCWDVKNQLETDWGNVRVDVWNISGAGSAWTFGPVMDQIRIDVLHRRTGGGTLERHTVTIVDLKSDETGQTTYNMGHNFFMYIWDTISVRPETLGVI